ncbi:hypothetical protein E5163_14225 [Marinicauda algicola]|uniref:Uncharacterized protein n=1 Tax=Marinicauda algicola TaxID=2029849 RepID=A0A4V3RXS2_9PROT|nr:hypothetical protein [Marinicauda algicola]TGY87589.1 hypothetical protein E5163_14225 [Marinicauda algicola]
MSEGPKIDPLATFERAVASMVAFGYVDKGWIASAFGAFLDRQEQKKEKAQKKTGFWKRLGRFFASFVPGLVPPDKPPSERILLGRDPASFKLLKSVLAHVPESGRKRASHGPRQASARPLDELVANADKDDLKLVAKFLHTSGLEDSGFPYRLIGARGDEPAAGKRSAQPAGGADRSAALSTLTGGLLYRFAYDSEGPLNWDDTAKIFRAEGVYRIYICPPEASYVEQRLLLIRLETGGSIIRVAEVRRRSTGYVMRGGYVIPASGVNTVILSSDFSSETIAEIAGALLPAPDRELILPAQTAASASASSFLQEHQLGFYTLVNRGGGEVRGSVLDAPAPASVVGYRLDPSMGSPVADSALGLMTAEQIDALDPRDRVLIASTGHSPSVSIELG